MSVPAVNASEASDEKHAPVKPLILFDGRLNGITVRVLKDDGCNTNVVSKISSRST